MATSFGTSPNGSLARFLTFIRKVAFFTSIGNWSVSQPRSGDPVLASTEPSMPNLISRIGKGEGSCGHHSTLMRGTHLDASMTSCSWECPAKVVWFGSMFSWCGGEMAGGEGKEKIGVVWRRDGGR